jgi:hypothetical protein
MSLDYIYVFCMILRVNTDYFCKSGIFVFVMKMLLCL